MFAVMVVMQVFVVKPMISVMPVFPVILVFIMMSMFPIYDASVSSDMIHGSVSSNASDTGMIAVFSPSPWYDHLSLKSALPPQSVDEGDQMYFYLSFAKIKNNTPVNCGIL